MQSAMVTSYSYNAQEHGVKTVLCHGYKLQVQCTKTQNKNCSVPWLQVTDSMHRNAEWKLFHATVTSYSYNTREYGIKKTVSRLSVCCLFIYNVTGVIASK